MAVIEVSGMIGSGKTSLVKILSELLETPAMYEDISKNEFMSLYYENRERWAFSMQVKMLADRFKSIKEASKTRNAILDQSLSVDKAVFAKTNYDDGGMTDFEWQTYNEMADNMMEELPDWENAYGNKLPDLNIILVTDMERTRKNIRGRGREAEEFEDGDETDQYFTRLNDNFNKYADNYNLSPKMIIDVTKLDFVNSKADRGQVLTSVLDMMRMLKLLTHEEFIKLNDKMIEMTTPDISTSISEDGTLEITVVDNEMLSDKAKKIGIKTAGK